MIWCVWECIEFHKSQPVAERLFIYPSCYSILDTFVCFNIFRGGFSQNDDIWQKEDYVISLRIHFTWQSVLNTTFLLCRQKAF